MIPEFGARLDGTDYTERPGVYAIIENGDRQVAVIETGSGYFLPGGGVETGETEVEALKREILEETGYQVLVLAGKCEAVEYLEARAEGMYYRIHGKFYRAQLEAKIGEGIEKDHRLVWLRQEDALKVLRRQSQVWAVQWLTRMARMDE